MIWIGIHGFDCSSDLFLCCTQINGVAHRFRHLTFTISTRQTRCITEKRPAFIQDWFASERIHFPYYLIGLF
ncbi:hypothetical protein MED222_05220 [Vibrio sp. MED222]|nr:hypothetical protein MED222_05220 [Vibrio sp. MED222]